MIQLRVFWWWVVKGRERGAVSWTRPDLWPSVGRKESSAACQPYFGCLQGLQGPVWHSELLWIYLVTAQGGKDLGTSTCTDGMAPLCAWLVSKFLRAAAVGWRMWLHSHGAGLLCLSSCMQSPICASWPADFGDGMGRGNTAGLPEQDVFACMGSQCLLWTSGREPADI